MVLKLSQYSLTLFVFVLSIMSSDTRRRRVVTWQNLEEFLKGGWWPNNSSYPGKAFSTARQVGFPSLDVNVTGNGIWSGNEDASDFQFKRNFTGLEGSANVIEANLTIMFFARGQPAPDIFFFPCENGKECSIRKYIPKIEWYTHTFMINITAAQISGRLELKGYSHIDDDIATTILNEVSYSYDTDEPDPTTTTTTTTATEPTTTTTTTRPSTESTSTAASTKSPPSETTTTEPSFQTTIEPWQNVIDFQRDIPNNGRWSFDCAIGYADVPSSFSCQAGSVNIPLESLNGEEGFWTKCGLRCLIEYAVQPSDRLYKARIFQKNIMTEVIYDYQSSEFIPGSGWVNLSVPLNGVKSIGIRLDHMDPDVFTLLDKITVEAESE